MSMRRDDAIDHIAARMTAVEDDQALAMRIAQALPDRSSQWMPFGWIARIAVGALATVAIVVFVRSSGPAKAGHHSAGIAPAEAASASVTPADVEQRSASVVSAFGRTNADGRTNAAGRTNSGLVVDRPDHEFSLPAIAAAAAMAIDPLAPANLAEDAPLTVESLQIADLPLTTELSQR